jgi:hypothetical protein
MTLKSVCPEVAMAQLISTIKYLSLELVIIIVRITMLSFPITWTACDSAAVTNRAG